MEKYSIIYDEVAVRKAVEGSCSKAETLRKLGLSPANANYKRLYETCDKFGIQLPDFKGLGVGSGRPHFVQEDLRDYSGEDYSPSGQTVRRFIVKSELLGPYSCSIDGCPISLPEWLGKPITIQLDHIDGNNKNNRLDNLRWLCPNCHAQTDTHTWNNVKKNRPPKKVSYCFDCGDKLANSKSKRCRPCSAVEVANDTSRHKADYPSLDVLLEMIKASSFSSVSRTLGVSDNAVRKHLKVRGVDPKTLQPY